MAQLDALDTAWDVAQASIYFLFWASIIIATSLPKRLLSEFLGDAQTASIALGAAKCTTITYERLVLNYRAQSVSFNVASLMT